MEIDKQLAGFGGVQLPKEWTDTRQHEVKLMPALLAHLSQSSRCVQKYVEVSTLGVSAQYQRRGLGNKLLTACLREALKLAAGCVACVLCVRRDNSSAQKLYAKLGFVQQDIIHKYYHGGAAGLVMTRNIHCSSCRLASKGSGAPLGTAAASHEPGNSTLAATHTAVVPETNAVKFVDWDGDSIEFRLVEGRLMEIVNSTIELEAVTHLTWNRAQSKLTDHKGVIPVPASFGVRRLMELVSLS